jgi:membrane fusion protein
MFRKQVSQAAHKKLYGSVTLTQPLSSYIVSIALFSCFSVAILFATQAEYARKESVKGYILPKKGEVKLFTNQVGTIERLYVIENDVINKGAPLVKLKNSQNLLTGIELTKVLKNELILSIENLNRELAASLDMNTKNKSRIEKQLQYLKKSLVAAKNIYQSNSQLLNLKEKKLGEHKALIDKGHLSLSQYDLIKEEYFSVKAMADDAFK